MFWAEEVFNDEVEDIGKIVMQIEYEEREIGNDPS